MKLKTLSSMPRSGNYLRLAITSSLAIGLAINVSTLAANLPVSPGDLIDFYPVNSACPTFSWSSDSTSGIELVVAPSSAPEDVTLTQELPAGANSWTPPANRCLPPGQYVWYFRDLNAQEGDWSDALGFEVASLPTFEEVEKARQVLERYVSSGGAVSNNYPITSSGEVINQQSGANAVPVSTQQVLPTATSNTQGNGTSAVQEAGLAPVSNAALAGISNSASSAGVLAGNATGGTDLALDGAVQAQVTESQWQLNSTGAQSFDFSNPSGDMTLTVNGQPVLTSGSASANEPISMFGAFGGNGTVDHTVAGTEDYNKTIAYYKNLTIPAGTTWVIKKPVAFIAVSGTCDIAGTITTELSGQTGGLTAASIGPHPGAPGNNAAGDGAGYGMHGGMHRVAVPMAISGAGGGGGGTGDAPMQRGGDGGGAEARGGEGGYPEFGTLEGRSASVDWDKRHLMTAGATDNIQFPPGLLRTDFFINFLYFPGAGGGAGAAGAAGDTGGKGGNGGGNVYLECRQAKFTGEIIVKGEDGFDGAGNMAGGGGGGGGGIAVIRTLDLQENTGTIQTSGGLGGTGSGGAGEGGNGRQGLVEIVEL